MKHSAEDVAVGRAAGEQVPQDAAQPAIYARLVLLGLNCTEDHPAEHAASLHTLRKAERQLTQEVVFSDRAADWPILPSEGGFRDAAEDRSTRGGLRGSIGGADTI